MGWCMQRNQVHGTRMGDSAVLAPAPGRGYQLQVGPPGALTVSVVMFPQQSVLALLRRVASGQPDGTLARPPGAIGAALRPAARLAVQSFAGRGITIIPECCTPVPPLADVPVAEQAAALRDIGPEALTEELQAEGWGYAVPSQWRAAARQPRQWLASMAEASLDGWAVTEPRWKAAASLFDREVRRVGTAAVRGGMETLLNNLHPLISCTDGVLAAAFPHDRCLALGRRRLVLIPMIASRRALVVSFDRPEVCYIGYPIRPAGPSPEAPARGALALILGPLRAAALQALHQPLTVNEVAAAVQCAPTTATYHLQQLAAADMITRERRGTSVWVSRTTRGSKLIDLLSD
jgi:DNA-binding transcriptional ArsR family regulator